MNTFEGIEMTLTFGNSRKEGSYVFTKFDAERLTELAKEMCREFVEETELLHELSSDT